MPIFLIFDPKHRLWVLVRTDSARQFVSVPTINVFNKIIKNNKFFPMKFSLFTAEKKSLCIAWASFRTFICVFSIKPEDQWSYKRSPEIWDM